MMVKHGKLHLHQIKYHPLFCWWIHLFSGLHAVKKGFTMVYHVIDEVQFTFWPLNSIRGARTDFHEQLTWAVRGGGEGHCHSGDLSKNGGCKDHWIIGTLPVKKKNMGVYQFTPCSDQRHVFFSRLPNRT